MINERRIRTSSNPGNPKRLAAIPNRALVLGVPDRLVLLNRKKEDLIASLKGKQFVFRGPRDESDANAPAAVAAPAAKEANAVHAGAPKQLSEAELTPKRTERDSSMPSPLRTPTTPSDEAKKQKQDAEDAEILRVMEEAQTTETVDDEVEGQSGGSPHGESGEGEDDEAGLHGSVGGPSPSAASAVYTTDLMTGIRQQLVFHALNRTPAEDFAFVTSGVKELASQLISRADDPRSYLDLLRSHRNGRPLSPPPGFSTDKSGGGDSLSRGLFGSSMKEKPQQASAGPARKKYFNTMDLPHRLLGILNKVTTAEDKYREVRNELLRLPITAADVETLDKVVDTFFFKAVREPPFSSLYAKLVAELCKVPKEKIAGDIKESCPYKLRRALLLRCQTEFEKPFKLQPQEMKDKDGQPLKADDLENLQINRKKYHSANIKFVGELVLLKLVSASVIQSILSQLLFGVSEFPVDVPYETLPSYDADNNELDLVKSLLTTTGEFFLKTKFGQEILPSALKRITHFANHHPVNRTRFVMLDLIDLFKRDFVPKQKPMMTEQEVMRAEFDNQLKVADALKQKQDRDTSGGSHQRHAVGSADRLGMGQPSTTPFRSTQPPPPRYGDHQTPSRRLDLAAGGASPSTGGQPTPPPPVQGSGRPQPISTPPPAATEQKPSRTQPPPVGTTAPPAPAAPPPFPKPTLPVSFESVAALMTQLSQSDDYALVVENLLQLNDLQKALGIWVTRALNTARCEKERGQLPRLLQLVWKRSIGQSGSNTVDIYTARRVLLDAAAEIVKTRKWEDSPRIWRMWATVVCSGHELYADPAFAPEPSSLSPIRASLGAERPEPNDVGRGNPVTWGGCHFVIHQGLHNAVLQSLITEFRLGTVSASEIASFITDVLLVEDSIVKPELHRLDIRTDYERFRPIPIVVAGIPNDFSKANEVRMDILQKAFLDKAFDKGTNLQALVFRVFKDGAGSASIKPEQVDLLMNAARTHPLIVRSPIGVAQFVSAARGLRPLFSLDPLEHCWKPLLAIVDFADREDRELFLVLELYFTSRILGSLLPSSAGFATMLRLVKHSILTQQTHDHALQVLSKMDDAQQLIGLGAQPRFPLAGAVGGTVAVERLVIKN